MLALIVSVCFLWMRQLRFERQVREFAQNFGPKPMFARLQIGAVLVVALLVLKKMFGGNNDA